MSLTVALLTVSDRAARGEYADRSGALLAELVRTHLGAPDVLSTVVPDEVAQIQACLLAWCAQDCALILTTGGTGLAPRDVTPEATRAVLEREVPGLAEAMRAASLRITAHAMLSRAVAGVRGRTLIINLPGSPKGVKETFEVIAPVLPHAIALLRETPEAAAHAPPIQHA